MGALLCKKFSVLGWPKYKVWVAFGWERNGEAHFYIYNTHNQNPQVYTMDKERSFLTDGHFCMRIGGHIFKKDKAQDTAQVYITLIWYRKTNLSF